MKRRGLRWTALLLCLMIVVPAFAAGINDRQGLVGHSGDIAAYLDGEGGLYLTGYEDQINSQYAAEIVWIDEDRVVYLAGEELADFGGTLVSYVFSDAEEVDVANGVYAACALSADAIYYISAQDNTQLMCASTLTNTSVLAGTTIEPMTALFNTPDGLVVEMDGGIGALLYDTNLGTFSDYLGTIAASASYQDGFYLRLSDEGMLSITAKESEKAEFIDFGVEAYDMLNGKVYYITNMNNQQRLKEFNPSDLSWRMLTVLNANIAGQLVASGQSLFLLNASTGEVLQFDIQTLSNRSFATVDLETIEAPDGYTLFALQLEAMSGQLNLYGVFTPVDLESTEEVPTFSFGDETPIEEELEEEEEVVKLVASWEIPNEETTADVLKPKEEYGSLSRGSRGESVVKMQQRLIDLNYLSGKADGIFGSQTQYAVRLLQTDLADRGIKVNGVASPEFQQILYGENLPNYDPYKPLSRGNTGLRVRTMQDRLRALGFLADAADGIYGARTEDAVALFQSENGLSEAGSATSQTLKKLYSANTSACASYIYLEKGDTGYRVKELNARLKELYYLEGTVGSTYNNNTVAAVKRYQHEVGLTENGVATSSIQQRLFSSRAPEYSGYITLARGDSNDRVADLQRRLRKLNYYSSNITGNFGSVTKAAVELFQKMTELDVTGVATVEMQKLLYSKNAPVYVEPTATPTVSPTPTPTPAPGEVGQPEISIFPTDSYSNGVYYLDPKVSKVNFTWLAEGAVSAYYVRISDGLGIDLISQEIQSTSGNLATTSLEKNMIYIISVGAIPKNGTVENACWSHVQFALKGTPAPTATATPTPTPVPTPTPTPAPGEVGIPDVSIEPVKSIGIDRVYYVEEGTLTIKWSASGDVDYYIVQVFDGMWGAMASEEFEGTSTTLGTKNMRTGEVYTLRITAVPINGSVDDGRAKDLRFALEDAQPTTSPTTEPTTSPTTEPTTSPTTVPIGTVSKPEINFSSVSYEEDGVSYVSGDLQINWYADGDVSEYYIRIYDSNTGTEFVNQSTNSTSINVPSKNLAEDTLYRIDAVAIPINGTQADGASASAYFALEPTPEPTDEPIGVVSEPEINFSSVSYEEDGVSYVSGDLQINWYADGDVSEYYIRIYDSNAGTEFVNQSTNSTSINVPSKNLAEDTLYRIDAVAIPTNGTQADGASASAYFALEPTPEPTEEPIPEPTEEPIPEPIEEPMPERTEEPIPEPIEEPELEQPEEPAKDVWSSPMNRNTDSAAIGQLQAKLEQWGWLTLDGSVEQGVLDGTTLQAISDFQTYVNEQYAGESGAQLVSVDLNAENPEIGVDTLKLIMNNQGVEIYNP